LGAVTFIQIERDSKDSFSRSQVRFRLADSLWFPLRFESAGQGVQTM